MTVITSCHDALSFPESLRRVVGEVVEDAAADGAVWVEVSLWPGLFRGRLGPDHEAVRLVLEAGLDAGARLGVGFGVMVAANRHAGPEAALTTARLAVARAGGLLAAPHAGELLGPPSVRDAMELLGADRILHGVRAIEDPVLLSRLAASGVCLDVCPTSNFRLGISDPESHPLLDLLAAGVRCSVNADDPLLFGTSLLKEYEVCRTRFSLTDDQIAGIAGTSIQASGAPENLKAAAATGVAQWLCVP